MMNAILTFCLLVLAAPEPMSAKELLNKMVEGRRSSFATADLVWVETFPDRPPEYRRSRYGAANWTFSRIPDPDGVVQYAQLGEPFSCWDSSYLVSADRVWNAMDGTQVRVHQEKSAKPGLLFGVPVIDARTLGLMPENTVSNLDEFSSRFGIDRNKDAVVSDEGDGIATVTIKSVGASKVIWWIDTKRNYNPVRVERRVDGRVVSDTRIELALYDNHVWFPKSIEQIRTGSNNSSAKYSTSLISVEFDRPNHPAVLTPAHIGVPRFSAVTRQGGPHSGEVCCWDGKDIITSEEMADRLRNKIVTDQDLTELRDRDRHRDATSPAGRWPKWTNDPNFGITKPSDVDEWEKFVRRFCLLRKLDERQRASARSILEDCRKSATPLISKAKGEKDVATKDALLASVTDIFSKSLVPRLESLLTIPQSQPTSRPVVGASNTIPKS